MPTLTELLGIAGGIPYWVSGTNYAQGKTVRSPTDHQLYVRIVAGGGATDPANDPGNWRPDGGRPIKSIQRGAITIPNGSASAIATITAVIPAKTALRWLGGSGYNSGGLMLIPRIELTNSTTVTAYAGGLVGGFMSCGWELTEYY